MIKGTLAIVIGCGALTLMAGCGGNEEGKSYLLRHAGVTAAEAARLAEAQVPGRAVKVELLNAGRHVVYEVEVIDTINQPHKIALDAETGKLVR
jgi:uncharacterized membrane protein YkoI